MDTANIARMVTSVVATSVTPPEKGWRWAPGVVLFPQSRCPYCEDVIRSKAIWLVRGYSLLGQGVPIDGQPFKFDAPHHPHATPSDVCMGNATDATNALFNGLNPESVWVNMLDWLEGPYWEHGCGPMEEARERGDNDEGDNHDNEFFCDLCSEYYDIDNYSSYDYRGSTYCSDCFNERAFLCYRCDGTFGIGDRLCGLDDEDYCVDCFDEKYTKCEDCNDMLKLGEEHRDASERAYCEDCYEPPTCDDCNEEFAEADLDRCVICNKTSCEPCADSEHEHPVHGPAPETVLPFNEVAA